MIKNKLLTKLQLFERKIAILMNRFQQHTILIPMQQLFQLYACQIKIENNSQIISVIIYFLPSLVDRL